MPLNRSACLDVLTVDAFATTTSKTISNFYDKRRAFKFARKEKISTWELIEGVKNASSLCLSWYGSTKLERKMLRYEYQQKLLLRHKHLNIHNELTYFKDKCDVPNDLMEASEPTITVVVPPPPPAPAPTIKKELKVNPLALTPNSNQMEGGMKINSPSTLNPLSADVILIGSNAPPHMMQQPGQSMPMHQINPTHNQVLSRMQQMHQGQQQQQQQQMQQQQFQPNPNDRKGTNRSLSTPDKQRGNGQGGSAKKRNPTTPRRANSNIRGANANAAAVAAVSNPAMAQPNQMMPNNPQYPMGQMQQQQKIITPQQQQQQQPVLMQQRSTNSPMLQQQQQAGFNNANFMNSNRPALPNTQPNPMSMPHQMNQPRMPNPAAQNFTNPNGQMVQAPINQQQPNQQFMGQTQPQAQPNPVQGRNMMPTQANRMSYAPQPVLNPAQQQQQQQQQQRKLPTQPVQQQQVVLGQQQKQPGPIFNAAQPNQAGRIIPNQPNMPVGSQQQMFNQQKPPTTALPAPRTTTPDPMMMQGMPKQQAPGQNPGFMTQGQQVQQRMPQGQVPMQPQQPPQQQPPRMQFNQGQPNANQAMMNQNQLAWQQQQRQQQQGMQQPRAQNPGQMAQGQPQQQQFQQQPQMQSQQFMQKQQLPNQVVI